ncbi:MAG: Collagen triple helix repeat-containing protein, partial [Frankiales bacterium]|nr:Collagen triple helix repeat-containing protein [Frankiales bacterium]
MASVVTARNVPRLLIALTVAAAAGGAGGAGAVALAANDPAPGLIQTCVSSAGALRLVADATSCRTGERSLTWNQRGVQGDRGPAGAAGAQGAPGVAGPPG